MARIRLEDAILLDRAVEEMETQRIEEENCIVRTERKASAVDVINGHCMMVTGNAYL